MITVGSGFIFRQSPSFRPASWRLEEQCHLNDPDQGQKLVRNAATIRAIPPIRWLKERKRSAAKFRLHPLQPGAMRRDRTAGLNRSEAKTGSPKVGANASSKSDSPAIEP